MSGIEVAGLVLGAWPVVMEALEGYREMFRTLKSWWKFQRTFEDFLDDVGTHRTLFDNNLEKLLDPFIESDSSMGILLADPIGAAWHDPALEQKLKNRLDSSYPFYMSIVCRMNDVLNDLQSLLGISKGQALAIWQRDSSRSEVEIEFQRIRLAFSKEKFNQIARLSQYNDELAKLLQTSDELAPSRRRRQEGSTISTFRKVREHARNLFGLFQLSWHCQCHNPHPVSLRLERRLRAKTADDRLRFLFLQDKAQGKVLIQEAKIFVTEAPLAFDVSGAGCRDPKEAASLPQRTALYRTKIEILSKIDEKATVQHIEKQVESSFVAASGGHSMTKEVKKGLSGLIPLGPRPKPRKQVSFAQNLVPAAIPLQTRESLDEKQVNGSQHIQNMCATINSLNEATECFGFLIDSQGHRHHLLSLRESCHGQKLEHRETLKDKLRGSIAKKTMTRQERFTIAVTMASSLLQFNGTGWLSDHWSKNSVYFHSTQAVNDNSQWPFLCTDFVSTGRSPRFTATPRSNPKIALSNLGIVLLELCFGKMIEEHPLREQYFGPNNQPNMFTDISTAKVWHEDVLGELGDEVSDAIRRCLDCSFGPKPNFDDREFQQAVLNDVVLPLQDLLKVWESPD